MQRCLTDSSQLIIIIEDPFIISILTAVILCTAGNLVCQVDGFLREMHLHMKFI